MNRRGLMAISLGLALHLALVAIWVLSDRPPRSGGGGGGRAAAAASMPVASRRGPDPAPRRRPEPPPDDVGTYLPSPPPVSLFGFRADLAKIRARWDALFPFVTAPVSFDVEGVADRIRASGGLVFIDPRRVPARPPRRPALAMSADGIQRLVDRSWTRRERWARFAEVAALTGRHDADAGRLPAVIRSYVQQNLMQPYEDTTALADPRRWVMLMLAADDRDYVDFVASYVRAHPRSRTSTELLFLVDALMQGNCNALVLLLETDPRRDLAWTAHENVEAWVLFDALRDYYRDRVGAGGVPTAGAIRQRYDEQRLRLLSTVLRQTPDGYRAGDAHFVIGRIRWAQGDHAAAVRDWRLIHVDLQDAFVDTYRPIVEALAAEGGTLEPEPLTVVRIQAALRGEDRRSAVFQDLRLRRFGYAPYMF